MGPGAGAAGYLKEYHPVLYSNMVLRGTLWTHLADLNEQAQQRLETIIDQMKTAEGVTEELKASDPAGLGAADEQYPTPERRKSCSMS